MGTRIYTNVDLMAVPTAGTNLVNKDYVDAAVNSNLDVTDTISIAWNPFTILDKKVTVRNGICEFIVVIQANLTKDGNYTAIRELPTPIMVSGNITGLVFVTAARYNENDKHYDVDPYANVYPYGKLSTYSGKGAFSIMNPEKDRIYIVQGIYFCL